LDGLQNKPKNVAKKEPLQFIDLGCECVVFCKTRRPIDPATFVEKICQESFESKVKNTRYTQKLTPITFSASASIEELSRLAEIVLKPHFHKEEGQEPYTFAIKVSTRNFNTLTKGEIIQKVAESIGRDHGHKVDLKKYDKLILVECFKNNIGMSVVNNYEKYQKFNLQQIFEKQLNDETASISRTHPVENTTTESSVKQDEEKTSESEETKEDETTANGITGETEITESIPAN
jgi:tRNA acetyltransferase TAN1